MRLRALKDALSTIHGVAAPAILQQQGALHSVGCPLLLVLQSMVWQAATILCWRSQMQARYAQPFRSFSMP